MNNELQQEQARVKGVIETIAEEINRLEEECHILCPLAANGFQRRLRVDCR